MFIDTKAVLELLDFVKMDKFYVTCHFKCKVTNKIIISTVPFEPYDGKIEIPWQEMLMHPLESYNRYYHTPITIYNDSSNESIVLKAFEKVTNYFEWDANHNAYVSSSLKSEFSFEQKVS